MAKIIPIIIISLLMLIAVGLLALSIYDFVLAVKNRRKWRD